MRRLLLVLVGVASLGVMVLHGAASAQSGNGIPGDCEYADGAYYQPGVFPRYEPHNRRVVLVNWTTGETVQELDTSLDAGGFTVLGWSVDCRYLAVGLGAPDRIDTVVYDVVASQRVGTVPDAHGQPHHITWGPDDYLVVETRSGAILWHVPTHTQTVLTTSFNTFTARNFSRLRWDAAHGQLIANLAVGGRAVYDLTTGQPVTEAANVSLSPITIYSGEVYSDVLISGRRYPCQSGYNLRDRRFYHRGLVLLDVSVRFDYTSGTIYLILDDRDGPDEVIQMVEDHVNAARFRFRGWSSSCRYFAASLSIPDRDASDTAVWDIVENRRVGTFADAREIDHPIYWSPTGDALVVETREGAYLWHLPTDTRTLITDVVETSLDGPSGIRSFYDIEWNPEAQQLLVVPVAASDEVRAYDIDTGQQVGVYAAANHRVPNALLPDDTGASGGGQLAEQAPLPTTPLEGESGMGRGGEGWRSSWRWFDDGCNGLIPRYEYQNNRRLVIVDLRQGEIVQVLGEDLNNVQYLYWSPDCRYFGTEVSWISNADEPYEDYPLDDTYRYRWSDTLVFWDVATGERVQEFPHPFRWETYSAVWWSPGGDRALVRTSEGFFLWHPANNQVALLIFADGGSDIQTYPGVYWDYERGQVLVSGWTAIYAFDMQTGMERYRFTTSTSVGRPVNPYGGPYFSVSDDHTMLFVSGNGVGVWNLDTLEHFYANGGRIGDRIALSPDGRYLAMGLSMIRVWDRAVLPEDFRGCPPTYSFPGPLRYVHTIRFVDDGVVETTDYYGNRDRWDIFTGAEIPIE